MIVVNAAVCLTAIVGLAVVAAMCWHYRRRTPSALWQMGVMLAGIWWSAGILLSNLAGDSPWHQLASALKTIGAPVMAICYHYVVRTLVRPHARPRPLPVIAMFAPVVGYLLMLLVPATRPQTLGTLLVTPDETYWVPGLPFWVLMMYAALVSVWAGASQAHAINLTALRHRPLLRSHLLGALLVLAGAVVSMVIIIRSDGGWPSSQVEWVTAALIGTAALDIWALLGQRFLQVTPIDRGSVLTGLGECVLVFDEEGRLSDYNEAAAHLFDDQLQPGLSRRQVMSWLGERRRLGDTEYVHLSDRDLTLTQQPTGAGTTLVLSDVTGANQYARELLSANEQLRRHVDTIEELRDELSRQAHRDSLTGLANRRRLQALLAQFADDEQPFTLVLIDVDHFKSVNDTHGHLVGDEVLIGTANGLRAFTGDGETLVRYGGEEFLLVIPRADLETGIRRAEDARLWFVHNPIVTGRGPVRVTISAGVADTSSAPSDDVLRLADQALYTAKAKGRNRVELHDPR